MQLVIGRIGRAHGVGGEVSVEVRTDSPELRFAPGKRVETDPDDRGPLTVTRTRWHAGRLLVGFAEVRDRAGAAALRGTLLVADSGTSPPTGDDEWWDHELAGLEVVTVAGVTVGRVEGVAHTPGADLLVVRGSDGEEALVPFVKAIVPTVDLAAGRIVVDPPEGLFDL